VKFVEDIFERSQKLVLFSCSFQESSRCGVPYVFNVFEKALLWRALVLNFLLRKDN